MTFGTVLVTGGSGLLGLEITKHLAMNGLNVISTYNKSLPNFKHPLVTFRHLDILDTLQLVEILEKCSHVIHCAAIVSFSRYKRNEMFETNVLGTKNLVDCMLKFNDKKLVHISSVAALGRSDGKIITENSMWSDGHPHTYYAKTKHLAELEVFRGIEEGLDATILNPSVILAPPSGDRTSGKLINYVKKGAYFYPKGFLNAVDARDVANAAFLALQKNTGEARITLNGFRISYQEFFSLVSKRLSKRTPNIPTNQFLNIVVWMIDSLFCLFTKKEPLITKETLQLSKRDYVYQLKNKELLEIQFRDMENTLDWCCQ
ncbi:MAG: NAD-dependent epimerase/dehydratase family protein [Cytophagales bacterium]